MHAKSENFTADFTNGTVFTPRSEAERQSMHQYLTRKMTHSSKIWIAKYHTILQPQSGLLPRIRISKIFRKNISNFYDGFIG